MPFMLIADEAHNLGSPRYARLLPSGATYRMALSATPERWFDEWGTGPSEGAFGPVVFELGLGEAIEMGALCRYYYKPRLVELTVEETQFYNSISAQFAALLAAGEDLEDPDSPLGLLLRRRAGVLGHAEGKLPLLRSDIQARRSLWSQLIYCAEGHRPIADDPDPADEQSQIERVVRMVGVDLGFSVHPYTSETPRATRRGLLRRFTAERDLKFLAAMRCLDEGVDIPDASGLSPGQFQQPATVHPEAGSNTQTSPRKDPCRNPRLSCLSVRQ